MQIKFSSLKELFYTPNTKPQTNLGFLAATYEESVYRYRVDRLPLHNSFLLTEQAPPDLDNGRPWPTLISSVIHNTTFTPLVHPNRNFNANSREQVLKQPEQRVRRLGLEAQ